MKKLVLLFLIQAITAFAAVAKEPAKISIKLGGSTLADNGRIAIKFVEIVEDSRCPVNVACVWAGNAKAKVLISKGKRRATIELNSGLDPKHAEAFGYRITFAELTPRPGEDKRTGPVLMVTLEPAKK